MTILEDERVRLRRSEFSIRIDGKKVYGDGNCIEIALTSASSL